MPPLPRGAAWLFVELTGDEPAELSSRASALGTGCEAVRSLVVTDTGQAGALWRIRADAPGCPAAARRACRRMRVGRTPRCPGPDGDYLRDFDALMTEYGLTGLPYGHFGDGCLHIRIDFPLQKPSGTTVFREFLLAAGHLVAGYGIRCRVSMATAGPGANCSR